MKIEEFKIDELVKAEYNPRTISQEQLEFLAKSIEKYGYVEPIIINKDKTIIGGHQRYEALKMLGETSIKCVVVDLDKTQEKALNIALNKISGEFDMPMLKDLLHELKIEDFDMELTGFSELEIDGLFNIKKKETEKDGFDTEDVGNDDGIIQYNIIFDDKEQQDQWYEFLKYLKNKYPECETIAERLTSIIGEITSNDNSND